MEVGWILLVVLIVLGTPIVALVALVRVLRLERTRFAGADPSFAGKLQALEQRILALERSLAQFVRAPAGVAPPARPEAQPPAAALPPPPRLAPPPAAAPPQPMPAAPQPGQPAKRRAELDWETLVGGRVLNRVGILALLLAVAFFLKFAFDNNWIGPTGRVAIGIFAGTALLVWSQWLLQRGYPYFSEGIAGLGAAVLYLSIYAGWSYYHLFSQAVAFASMIVVTIAMTGIAIGRDSQRIAVLALAGGFLTPMLVSTGTDQQIVLFTYLAVLDAALLLLAHAKDWRLLEGVAFVWTQVYFWEWYERFYQADKLERTLAYAALFFVIFAALPLVRSRRKGVLQPDQIALVLLNAFSILAVLRLTLWPEHRWTLTLAVLLLAVLHLVASRTTPAPAAGQAPLVSLMYAGLALLYVTLAIPIRLDGKWITIAWAVEGAILIWTGFRAQMGFLRGAGLSLFVLTALRLFALPIPARNFLLNARFGTEMAVVASFVAALVLAQQHRAALRQDEGNAYAVLGIGTNVLFLWALSHEVWDVYGRMRTSLGMDSWLAQQLALSLLWTLYASVLIVWGVRRASPALRWQALALFGVVVGKAFLYDLSFLQRGYRILSFFVLGVVLLIVSFLYQRRRAAGRPGEP